MSRFPLAIVIVGLFGGCFAHAEDASRGLLLEENTFDSSGVSASVLDFSKNGRFLSPDTNIHNSDMSISASITEQIGLANSEAEIRDTMRGFISASERYTFGTKVTDSDLIQDRIAADERIKQALLEASQRQASLLSSSATGPEDLSASQLRKYEILERSKTRLEQQAYRNNSGEGINNSELAAQEEVIIRTDNDSWVICQGSPWTDDPDFEVVLADAQEQIRDYSMATGRINPWLMRESESDVFLGAAGTAIAVGKNLVATNHHVLFPRYATLVSGSLRFLKIKSRHSIRIEFPREYENCPNGVTTTIEAKVTGIKYVHPTLDLVILEVDKELEHTITFDDAAPSSGNRVGVIGYTDRPQEQETHLRGHEIDDLFRAPDLKTPFRVQRLSEGAVGDPDGLAEGEFRHDATTWKGNSGSIIFGLSDGKPYGIHFGGIPRLHNFGIRSEIIADALNTLAEGT